MKPSFAGSHEDLAVVLRDIGRLFPIVGGMALVSLAIPLIFGETYAIAPLLLTAAACLLLGVVFYVPFRSAGEPQLSHAMMTAAIGWLLVPAVGALPFVLVPLFADGPTAQAAGWDVLGAPANAFFESMSGFTTTGLSVVTRSDLLPHTLQWWRSLIQWIGGLGVLIVVLSVLSGPRPASSIYNMYYAEARSERIRPTIRSTVRTMWWMYVLFTVVSLALQSRVGVPMWQAVNHAMTAVSTGGFSISAPGESLYVNLGGLVVLVGTMFAGAISFSTHYETLASGWRRLFGDYQTRAFLAFIAAGAGLLVLENVATLGANGGVIRDSMFHFVAAATTTGFQTTDVATWSETAKLILAAGMFVGGAAGSTAGGVKIIRLIVLLKGVQWRFRQIMAPRRAIVPFRIGRASVDASEVGERLEDAALMFFLWIAFLGIGVLALLHSVPPEFTLADVVLEATSAQSNTGLTAGITGPSLPLAAKLILSFSMWIGRLEILPVLMLFRSLLSRQH